MEELREKGKATLRKTDFNKDEENGSTENKDDGAKPSSQKNVTAKSSKATAKSVSIEEEQLKLYENFSKELQTVTWDVEGKKLSRTPEGKIIQTFKFGNETFQVNSDPSEMTDLLAIEDLTRWGEGEDVEKYKVKNLFVSRTSKEWEAMTFYSKSNGKEITLTKEQIEILKSSFDNFVSNHIPNNVEDFITLLEGTGLDVDFYKSKLFPKELESFMRKVHTRMGSLIGEDGYIIKDPRVINFYNGLDYSKSDLLETIEIGKRKSIYSEHNVDLVRSKLISVEHFLFLRATDRVRRNDFPFEIPYLDKTALLPFPGVEKLISALVYEIIHDVCDEKKDVDGHDIRYLHENFDRMTQLKNVDWGQILPKREFEKYNQTTAWNAINLSDPDKAKHMERVQEKIKEQLKENEVKDKEVDRSLFFSSQVYQGNLKSAAAFLNTNVNNKYIDDKDANLQTLYEMCDSVVRTSKQHDYKLDNLLMLYFEGDTEMIKKAGLKLLKKKVGLRDIDLGYVDEMKKSYEEIERLGKDVDKHVEQHVEYFEKIVALCDKYWRLTTSYSYLPKLNVDISSITSQEFYVEKYQKIYLEQHEWLRKHNNWMIIPYWTGDKIPDMKTNVNVMKVYEMWKSDPEYAHIKDEEVLSKLVFHLFYFELESTVDLVATNILTKEQFKKVREEMGKQYSKAPEGWDSSKPEGYYRNPKYKDVDNLRKILEDTKKTHDKLSKEYFESNRAYTDKWDKCFLERNEINEELKTRLFKEIKDLMDKSIVSDRYIKYFDTNFKPLMNDVFEAYKNDHPGDVKIPVVKILESFFKNITKSMMMERANDFWSYMYFLPDSKQLLFGSELWKYLKNRLCEPGNTDVVSKIKPIGERYKNVVAKEAKIKERVQKMLEVDLKSGYATVVKNLFEFEQNQAQKELAFPQLKKSVENTELLPEYVKQVFGVFEKTKDVEGFMSWLRNEEKRLRQVVRDAKEEIEDFDESRQTAQKEKRFEFITTLRKAYNQINKAGSDGAVRKNMYDLQKIRPFASMVGDMLKTYEDSSDKDVAELLTQLKELDEQQRALYQKEDPTKNMLSSLEEENRKEKEETDKQVEEVVEKRKVEYEKDIFKEKMPEVAANFLRLLSAVSVDKIEKDNNVLVQDLLDMTTKSLDQIISDEHMKLPAIHTSIDDALSQIHSLTEENKKSHADVAELREKQQEHDEIVEEVIGVTEEQTRINRTEMSRHIITVDEKKSELHRRQNLALKFSKLMTTGKVMEEQDVLEVKSFTDTLTPAGEVTIGTMTKDKDSLLSDIIPKRPTSVKVGVYETF